MTVPLLRQLASRVLVTSEPLIVAKVKICFTDFLAAALAGTQSPSCGIAARATRAWGEGPCTLIGLAHGGVAPRAALYNGIVGHAEEIDDSHSGVSGLHLATTIIPAVMALAEERNLAGSDVIRAVACGYEAAGRLCRCMDRTHRERGFHSTGTVAPFGAAAACAVLLGLDEAGLAHSMGLAASTAAGIFAFLDDGATVKHFHAGRAALDGLTAALLGAQGLTAPGAVLEAREGFFHAYAGRYQPEPLFCDLEEPEIFAVYHKLYSACGHAFPAIDAALALHRELQANGMDFKAIRRLRFAGYHHSALLSNPAPRTVQECRFSIPWAIALALEKGNVSRHDMASFAEKPYLLPLCHSIEVTEDPALTAAFPDIRGGELAAELVDGRHLVFRVDVPRGMPRNPASAEDIRQKFLTETRGILSPEGAAAILEAVNRLDKEPIWRLGQALRSAILQPERADNTLMSCTPGKAGGFPMILNGS